MVIYLSRSNTSCPGVFSLVEQALKNLGHTVLTYNGGVYDNIDLLKADALVLVPGVRALPSIHGKEATVLLDEENVYVGKGQYDQCCDFDELTTNGHNIFIVHEVNVFNAEPALYLSNLYSFSVYNTADWKQTYGIISTENNYENANLLLEPIIFTAPSVDFDKPVPMLAVCKHLKLI